MRSVFIDKKMQSFIFLMKSILIPVIAKYTSKINNPLFRKTLRQMRVKLFSRKGGIQACIGLHVFCLFAPSDAGNFFLH